MYICSSHYNVNRWIKIVMMVHQEHYYVCCLWLCVTAKTFVHWHMQTDTKWFAVLFYCIQHAIITKCLVRCAYKMATYSPLLPIFMGQSQWLVRTWEIEPHLHFFVISCSDTKELTIGSTLSSSCLLLLFMGHSLWLVRKWVVDPHLHFFC